MMINMIAKIRITITLTEKINNRDNSNNIATQVTIKTQTRSNGETPILKWK